MRKFLLLVGLTSLLLSTFTFAQAQEDEPYLYYYSRMFGGLIIEHPDGSDSRLIGADVIPPGLSGIGGPGWSPSGNYFAAYGVRLEAYSGSYPGIYLIDRQGNSNTFWLYFFSPAMMSFGPSSIQWSPTNEDLLFVIANAYSNSSSLKALFFLVIDATTGTTLAEYGGIYDDYTSISEIFWGNNQDQIQFYIAPTEYEQGYYRITMQFDGMVLKEPITLDEFQAHNPSSAPTIENRDDLYYGYGVSNSGNFEASGNHPPILRNLQTQEEVELPAHSQGTVCSKYLWNEREDYLITLVGTAATDGCGSAAIGVTDQHGQLWRELGGCTLFEDSCAGWLPPQVDISTLPEGQPQPIQLDPIAYEPDEVLYGLHTRTTADFHLLCQEGEPDFIVDNAEPQQILYRLGRTRPCYNPDSGLPVTFAYDPQHDLLATYSSSARYVTVWSTATDPAAPILKLNTFGYELEFTPDGSQLRARNTNGWKIYDVADILAAAGMDVETPS